MTTVIDTTKTADEIKPGMVYRYDVPRIDGGRDIIHVTVRYVIPMIQDTVLVAGVEASTDPSRMRFTESGRLLVNWYDEIPNDTPVTVLYSQEVGQ
ncbi:hypothetical protein BH762_gp039 [Gordonia phage OneUp]|uniref:Uncharacterized protein n=1 Tax=Gordonia phage OneUp TaxID=1838074 RepID=A0A160DF20_9CAUD|nr:hypothetical protein BH762_gp039 [Gordonia phage OneUp]ANA86479.1 hypothetical protein PBI_ONEUP_146 [Gordonia phage OneUp]